RLLLSIRAAGFCQFNPGGPEIGRLEGGLRGRRVLAAFDALADVLDHLWELQDIASARRQRHGHQADAVPGTRRENSELLQVLQVDRTDEKTRHSGNQDSAATP